MGQCLSPEVSPEDTQPDSNELKNKNDQNSITINEENLNNVSTEVATLKIQFDEEKKVLPTQELNLDHENLNDQDSVAAGEKIVDSVSTEATTQETQFEEEKKVWPTIEAISDHENMNAEDLATEEQNISDDESTEPSTPKMQFDEETKVFPTPEKNFDHINIIDQNLISVNKESFNKIPNNIMTPEVDEETGCSFTLQTILEASEENTDIDNLVANIKEPDNVTVYPEIISVITEENKNERTGTVVLNSGVYDACAVDQEISQEFMKSDDSLDNATTLLEVNDKLFKEFEMIILSDMNKVEELVEDIGASSGSVFSPEITTDSEVSNEYEINNLSETNKSNNVNENNESLSTSGANNLSEIAINISEEAAMKKIENLTITDGKSKEDTVPLLFQQNSQINQSSFSVPSLSESTQSAMSVVHKGALLQPLARFQTSSKSHNEYIEPSYKLKVTYVHPKSGNFRVKLENGKWKKGKYKTKWIDAKHQNNLAALHTNN